MPQFILSTKDEIPHLALIVKTTNNTDIRYIFLGGHSFSRYLNITKLDKSGKWEDIVHPSNLEILKRDKIESEQRALSYYKDNYQTRTPLFRSWAMGQGMKSMELDYLDLILNGEIATNPLFKKIENCIKKPFSLFFVEKKSVYEDFWNMDFMLQEKGRYRVFFSPEKAKVSCNYNFKGFQLSSNQIVQFDSTEIDTN